MSHYEINYIGLEPQEAYDQAYSDIIEYIGGHKFDQIVKDFRAYPPMSVDVLAIYLSIAGIQGYPVTVMHDIIWPYG